MLQGKSLEEGRYRHLSFSDSGRAWAIDLSKNRTPFVLDPKSKTWVRKAISGAKAFCITALDNGDAWATATRRRIYRFNTDSSSWQLEQQGGKGSTNKPQLLSSQPNIDSSRTGHVLTSAMAGSIDPGGAGWSASEMRNAKWAGLSSGWFVDTAYDSKTGEVWATNAYKDIWRLDRKKKTWLRQTVTDSKGNSTSHAATLAGSQNSVFLLVRGRRKIWSKALGAFEKVPTNGGNYPIALGRAPAGKGVVRIYPNGSFAFSF